MSTTLDAIRDAFLTWGNLITGRIAVLENNGEGPQPRNPYFTVFIESFTIPTWQVDTFQQATNEDKVTSVTLITININVYGGNAMQSASRLAHSLFASARYEDLWKICGLSGIENAQDMSFLETGSIKQRALLPIKIYANLVDDFDADFFDTVDLNVSAPDQDYSQDEVVGLNDPPNPKAAICNV